MITTPVRHPQFPARGRKPAQRVATISQTLKDDDFNGEYKDKYVGGAKIGDSNINLFQGVLESYSMFSPYNFKGTEVVVQQIPHHRVLGMFLQRRPGKSAELHRGLFAGDHENEILVMQRGIPAKYLGYEKPYTNIKVSDHIQ